MIKRWYPGFVTSNLSQMVARDGISVRVEIVRMAGTTDWFMAVYDGANTSTDWCWEEPFATDEEAYAEFERTAAEEGMQTFVGSGDFIRLPGETMNNSDLKLVTSSLSRTVTRDGITVGVDIFRMQGATDWLLGVANGANDFAWDEAFATDEAAYAEFERTVAKEGIRTVLDSGKVIPFPR